MFIKVWGMEGLRDLRIRTRLANYDRMHATVAIVAASGIGRGWFAPAGSTGDGLANESRIAPSTRRPQDPLTIPLKQFRANFSNAGKRQKTGRRRQPAACMGIAPLSS